MGAGALDRRIAFYRPTELDDGFARGLGVAALLAEVWAEKRDVSDAERFRSGAVSAEITARFRVRWSPVTEALKPTDVLRCNGRDYDIVGIKEQGRREFLEITTRARMA